MYVITFPPVKMLLTTNQLHLTTCVDCVSTEFSLLAFKWDDGFVYFLITMGLCLALLIYVSITPLYCLDGPGKFISL